MLNHEVILYYELARYGLIKISERIVYLFYTKKLSVGI